jgi:hypothetical protein
MGRCFAVISFSFYVCALFLMHQTEGMLECSGCGLRWALQGGLKRKLFFLFARFLIVLFVFSWERLYACLTLRELLFWLRPDRLVRVSLRRCLRPPELHKNGLISLIRQQGSSKAEGVVWIWIENLVEREAWFQDASDLWRKARVRGVAKVQMDVLLYMLVQVGMGKWYDALVKKGVTTPADIKVMEKGDFEGLGMTPFEKRKLLKFVYDEVKEAI